MRRCMSSGEHFETAIRICDQRYNRPPIRARMPNGAPAFGAGMKIISASSVVSVHIFGAIFTEKAMGAGSADVNYSMECTPCARVGQKPWPYAASVGSRKPKLAAEPTRHGWRGEGDLVVGQAEHVSN